MKASVSQVITLKKAVIIRTLVFTSIVMIGMASCKTPEDCGAYQGSRKSSRSYKAKKRYSEANTLPILGSKAC
jgi:hypothetical protein